jgi:hypothetical protein
MTEELLDAYLHVDDADARSMRRTPRAASSSHGRWGTRPGDRGSSW